MAATQNEIPLNQSLQSSKSERTLLDGTRTMLEVSESSSQRSSTGAKNESDLEAQSAFDLPRSNEKQDLNFVSMSSNFVHVEVLIVFRSLLREHQTRMIPKIGPVRRDGHVLSLLPASHSSLP